MRPSQLLALAASVAIVISITTCGGRGPTAPETAGKHGPLTPQGPSATPPNLAPSADAGQDVTVECASHAGSTLTLDGSRSSDSDGRIVLSEWFEEGRLIATGATPTVTLGLGAHPIILRVTDDHGGTNDDLVVVTVRDTRAPEIVMTVDPATLWPPNHTMRLVSRGIAAVDVCDAAPSLDVSVASNEPVNGLGDGDTAPDWLVERNADGTVNASVRAERSGLGAGRLYTIAVAATDHSGNAATRSGTVTVPHNQ